MKNYELWCDLVRVLDNGKAFLLEAHTEKPHDWDNKIDPKINLHLVYKVALDTAMARISICERALREIRKEGDRFALSAIMDWDAVQVYAHDALLESAKLAKGE